MVIGTLVERVFLDGLGIRLNKGIVMIDCRCPSCGSQNTQLAKLAYEQSMRRGRHFESTSDFSKRVAPPTRINPALSAVFGFMLWGGLNTLDQLENMFPDHWFIKLIPSLLFNYSVEISVLTSAVLLVWLISMNMKVYRTYQSWEHKWICRRCGHQWFLSTYAKD